MDYVEVNGTEVPAIGLGTWQLKGKRCVKTVQQALDMGYRHIDAAQIYENEDRVGKGIQRSDVDRDEFFLTTKVWRDRLAPGKLKKSVEASLNRLNTDYVDLLLIHWPFPDMKLEASLEKMKELIEENMVRHIGVSNFTADQFENVVELSDAKIFTNQVEYHPFLNQKEVLSACRRHSAMLTSYSPLARGEVMGNSVLEEIAEAHGKSEAQVALRWLIQQNKVSAIPKASSEEHIKQNLEVFDFELCSSEVDRINDLNRNDRKVNPEFAPDWD